MSPLSKAMFKKLRSPVAVCDVITQNDIAPMPELDSWISGAGIVFPALGWRFCRAVFRECLDFVSFTLNSSTTLTSAAVMAMALTVVVSFRVAVINEEIMEMLKLSGRHVTVNYLQT